MQPLTREQGHHLDGRQLGLGGAIWSLGRGQAAPRPRPSYARAVGSVDGDPSGLGFFGRSSPPTAPGSPTTTPSATAGACLAAPCGPISGHGLAMSGPCRSTEDGGVDRRGGARSLCANVPIREADDIRRVMVRTRVWQPRTNVAADSTGIARHQDDDVTSLLSRACPDPRAKCHPSATRLLVSSPARSP